MAPSFLLQFLRRSTRFWVCSPRKAPFYTTGPASVLPKSATGAAQSRKTCQPTPPERLKSNLGIMKGAKNARAANIVVGSFVAGMLANPAATQTGQVTDRDDVLRHLNAVIRWYKDSTTKIRAGQEPSDTIYVTNAQNLGAQAVRLAFQSSRADVTLNQQNGS